MIFGAFDVGGTSIKYGILDEQGKILHQSQTVTNASAGGKKVIDQVKDIARNLQADYALDGVAVSTAGQVNNLEGTIVHATESIPDYTGLNVKKELEEALRLPVAVENDVNAAALGEYWWGAARETNHFLCMTLGTGIGGAIVMNGKVYTGASFSAGEFGHMTLYPGGKDCPCGDKGCYEMYASSKSLERRVEEYFGEDSLRDLFAKAKNENGVAEYVVDQWVSDVALGMKSLVHIFNPPLIVIGGGVSEQGDYLLDKLKRSVNAQIMPSFQRPLQLKMTQNGNDANLQGAVFQLLALL
ncbi:ROK family protein [Natribacillus halophilus]|uniref:ROK family protein (Putative glucokinase) n=1 Tax=Natribacillus halophilus TaxID=549003 RepID=A0A1G8QPG0_9BACI|nr:ROK family protein [Natribacillus halophilus]SDJ06664.1 ROK family protein (putative glucokinase) [Natribacillus halophilus]